MLGIQLVDVYLKSSPVFKIIPVSLINNFKVVLTGRGNRESFIRILLETEGETQEEIYQKLGQQIENLKLYINLNSGSQIDVKPAYSPEVFAERKYLDERLLDSLNFMVFDKNLPKYLDKKNTQQHKLLQLALDELGKDDIFNAFPKLINWLDENESIGTSKFCPIRDACNHGALDDDRALKKIDEKFPGQFEIEDNVLKRDSQKNKDQLKKYLPEVLEHVRRVFRTKYML